mgnify:CR=1 FL=1
MIFLYPVDGRVFAHKAILDHSVSWVAGEDKYYVDKLA